MKKISAIAFLFFCFGIISAQKTPIISVSPTPRISVSPTSVNVNSQNPSVVFLTFGPIPVGYVPAEAIWCGELVPANERAIGFECRPDTIYGTLPDRYNRSQTSGNGGFTDIMAIPPSVVRRAYQAALNGESAEFFYVRRFVSTTIANPRQSDQLQPDQFVNVTCRMTRGGAGVPFALTDVEIKTASKEPILFVKAGEKFPEVFAEIQYNGTGRLKGRWEIVQPGEELPEDVDLLTEATLPIEDRGKQRRFTQVERFNHFLPPTGKFQLKLEDPRRMPILAEGQYVLLLRIEATDDKESDSDLAFLGVGNGVVHSGAVSAFPMPTLKFFVAGRNEKNVWEENAIADLSESLSVKPNAPLIFDWKKLSGTAVYRLEISDEQSKAVLSAVLLSPVTSYRAPSWFWTRFGDKKNLAWRVLAIDENGKIISQCKSQKLVLKN